MSEWLPIDTAFLEFVKTEDALFHYTKKSVAADLVLPSKCFKLSQRIGANDPWEYRFRLLNATGSFPPGSEELYNEVHPSIDRVLRQEYRVASFCSNHRPELILDNGDRIEDPYALVEGWNKPRMWSQYGENHSGACLVFSRASIEMSIKSGQLPIGSYSYGFVFYTQKNRMPYQSFTIDASRLISEGPADYATEFARAKAKNIFFLKHIDYRDEAEYRVAIHDPMGVHQYIHVADSLKGIIWGDRTTNEELKALHIACYGANAGCGFVRWDRGASHLLFCSKRGET